MHRDALMMADRFEDEGDTSILTATKPKTKRPPLYKVLLLNDDFTPMEFVVHVLERFFGLNHAQAFEIMLTVHKKGVHQSNGAICSTNPIGAPEKTNRY